MKTKLLFLVICVVKNACGVIYQLNATQYELIPPVFHLEPYEACLSQPGALYCTLDATLISDTPSPLLDMIQEFSAFDATHFNHSAITYGLCVTKSCKTIYENTTADLRVVLEACLNKTIHERYGLKTRVSENFHCNSESRNIMVLDTGDFIVAGGLLILVLLNIVGSLYDYHCTSGKSGEGIKILLCFSIRRNWRKVVQPISNPRLKRLKACNGLRVLTIMCVVMVHSFLPVASMVDNPRKVEGIYNIMPYHLVVNGTVVVQTFFIMSAFLLVYNMMVTAEKHSLTWDLMPKAVGLRWLRLTPPYAVVLAITSTWMRHAVSGPFWHKTSLVEIEDCRRDWWLHLLFLNNYKDYSQCMAHTWYLAADMQLFIVGTILCLALKTNRSRKIVLPIFLVIGIIIPCLHTYYQDLEGIVLLTPENGRTFFTLDKVYNNVYKRGHTNIPGCIIGMILGYLVHHWQNTGVDFKKYEKYRYLYWMLVPFGMAVIVSGWIFYVDGPRRPMFLRVTYAGLMKPLFGLTLAAVFAPMVFKYENVFRGVLEWSAWTTMARVSYSAFLTHALMIRTFAGAQTTLLHFSEINMTTTFTGTLVITFMCAYPFYLLVESPIAQLVKLIVDPRKVFGNATRQKSEDVEVNADEDAAKD